MASHKPLNESTKRLLRWVRNRLADGTINEEPGNEFDMTTFCSLSKCGTVCCIGGWMAIRALGLKPNVGFVYCGSRNARKHIQ